MARGAPVTTGECVSKGSLGAKGSWPIAKFASAALSLPFETGLRLHYGSIAYSPAMTNRLLPVSGAA